METTRAIRPQLDLFAQGARIIEPKPAAQELADVLAGILTEPVRLTVHDNRSTMVSFRRHSGGLHYRVHHMFLDAPSTVVRALADFAGSGRGRAAKQQRNLAGVEIDSYVRQHRSRIGEPRSAPRLSPVGRHHDLRAIFDRLNAEHFNCAVDARIGWGMWRRGGRRRTIKTGVYLQDARIIRIHPSLDRPEVPVFYVAAVIYHEMLHQIVPAMEVEGRRVVHSRAFRERERAFPDHGKAKAWEEAHLALLLSSS